MGMCYAIFVRLHVRGFVNSNWFGFRERGLTELRDPASARMVGQRTGRSCHGAHDLPRSKPPPAPPFLRAFPHFEHFVEVAPGFWNLHTPFKVLNGALDVCTHMSVCRLADDRFIAIDAAPLSEEAQRELAELTRQGSSLVAVIMTHPFHTLSIPGFHALYPSSEARPWYGCPRHLLKVTKDSQGAPIAWKGDLADVGVRDAFEPEIAMSVPDGGEIVDPKPPDRNHLSTVLVLHRPSRTVHCDDLLNFIERPSLLLRLAIGKGMHFHPSLLT